MYNCLCLISLSLNVDCSNLFSIFSFPGLPHYSPFYKERMKALDADTAGLATTLQGIGGIHKTHKRTKKSGIKKKAGEGEGSKTDQSVEQTLETGAVNDGNSNARGSEKDQDPGLFRKPKRVRENQVVDLTEGGGSGVPPSGSVPTVPPTSKTWGTVSGPSRTVDKGKGAASDAPKWSQFLSEIPTPTEWEAFNAQGFDPMAKDIIHAWFKVFHFPCISLLFL